MSNSVLCVYCVIDIPLSQTFMFVAKILRNERNGKNSILLLLFLNHASLTVEMRSSEKPSLSDLLFGGSPFWL